MTAPITLILAGFFFLQITYDQAAWTCITVALALTLDELRTRKL